MSEYQEPEVTALALIGDAADVGTLASLDHRDHRLYLGALQVGVGVEKHLHETAVPSRGRLVSG